MPGHRDITEILLKMASNTIQSINKILESLKLREFADSKLKFDENIRKFFKRLENTYIVI